MGHQSVSQHILDGTHMFQLSKIVCPRCGLSQGAAQTSPVPCSGKLAANDPECAKDKVARKITVHSYWTWNPEVGLDAIPSDQRTRRQIEDMKGLIIPGTDQEVEEADLREDGSYVPKFRPESTP